MLWRHAVCSFNVVLGPVNLLALRTPTRVVAMVGRTGAVRNKSGPLPEGQRIILDRGKMTLAKDCVQCGAPSHCVPASRLLRSGCCAGRPMTALIAGRPMTWRKKWEKDWADVKYCSDKCRHSSKRDK